MKTISTGFLPARRLHRGGEHLWAPTSSMSFEEGRPANGDRRIRAHRRDGAWAQACVDRQRPGHASRFVVQAISGPPLADGALGEDTILCFAAGALRGCADGVVVGQVLGRFGPNSRPGGATALPARNQGTAQRRREWIGSISCWVVSKWTSLSVISQ